MPLLLRDGPSKSSPEFSGLAFPALQNGPPFIGRAFSSIGPANSGPAFSGPPFSAPRLVVFLFSYVLHV